MIFLFMEGGPSQMDLFDPKPELQKWHGKSLPPSMTKDLKLAFIKPTAAVLASPREFKPYGQSGMVFRITCRIPRRWAMTFAWSGPCIPMRSIIIRDNCCCSRVPAVRASDYGRLGGVRVGSESKNLPGFAVLASGVGTSGGASNFSSGFLPSVYQGTMLRSSRRSDPVSQQS